MRSLRVLCFLQGTDGMRAFSPASQNKNAGDRSLPRTRRSRNASIYDLHEKAGGLPLLTITAPSIHPVSEQGREVCKQIRKLTSR